MRTAGIVAGFVAVYAVFIWAIVIPACRWLAHVDELAQRAARRDEERALRLVEKYGGRWPR